MNYTTRILECLTQGETLGSILLAPSAPPVMRTIEGMTVVVSDVMDAGDVMDTLKALCDRASLPAASVMAGSGTFSFGMQNAGRIRVNYATQRGSKVVSIQRMPFRIPPVESVFSEGAVVERLSAFLRSNAGNLVCVHGRSYLANGLLAYVLLDQVNQAARRMIHVVERTLTYLMAHGDSLVIQSELGVDVASFAEGIAGARRFHPDILFLGDVGFEDAVPGLIDVARGGTNVLLTSGSLSRALLHRKFLREVGGAGEALAGLSCLAAEVVPNPGKLIDVRLSEPLCFPAE